MSKVLVISTDTIPIKCQLSAGPGIRAWEIARGLKRYGHQVTIAVPEFCFSLDIEQDYGIKILKWNYQNLISFCDKIEAVFIPQGDPFLSEFFVKHIRKDLCVIVDVYDPNLIETLNLFPSDDSGITRFADYLTGVVTILKRGDFFACANNRQRYYYLGILNVLGRINPLTYNEKLIDIIPFGVPDEDPVYEERTNVMRGSFVNNDDLILLWFGGIYPWFDAITLIKAIEIAVNKNPKIKLVIMGALHPRMHVPPDNYIKTLEFTKQLGLYNKNVFFTEWRPYDERIYWYKEADVGICTYPLHLETDLSNRTRVVDMLWGGLPVITTEGDELSELIKQYDCGETVIPNNPEKLAEVLLDILSNHYKRKKMGENTKRLVDERFRWTKVVKPLAEFLENPVIAKDRRNECATNTLLWYIDTIDRHRAYIPSGNILLEQEIRKKDQHINQLGQQIDQLNQQIIQLNQKIDHINKNLNDVYNSFTWRLLKKYDKMIERLFPPGTKRYRYYNVLLRGLKKDNRKKSELEG